MMINISKNKCVGCGICMGICPEGLKIVNGISEIQNKNVDCLKKTVDACPQNAIKNIERDLIIAIGTDDDIMIKQDDHVGMSKFFQIWKYSQGELIFKVKKENVKYKEDETRIHGDPGKAKTTSSVLGDVEILVGKMFGPNIVRLRNKYVCAVIREPQIKNAIEIIKDNINEIYEEQDKSEKRGIILN